MSKPKDDPRAALRAVREALPTPSAYGFCPSEEQRELKAAFWLEFRRNPLCDEKDVCPSLVDELTGKDVTAWAKDARFWPWFAMKERTRQLLEVSAEMAAELVLFYLNPAVPMNDNARVSLIKVALEFSGRQPPMRREVKWQDSEVGEMNEDQLKEFIAAQTQRLKPAQPK